MGKKLLSLSTLSLTVSPVPVPVAVGLTSHKERDIVHCTLIYVVLMHDYCVCVIVGTHIHIIPVMASCDGCICFSISQTSLQQA